ncbi:MAG: hypothetical protein JSW26_11435, partial [Desulfobacterales bacterium]
MSKIYTFGVLFLFLFAGLVLAAPIAKHLLDAEPEEALLINVDKWFQNHPIEKGQIRMDMVFKSPRALVGFARIKGAPLGRHIHT